MKALPPSGDGGRWCSAAARIAKLPRFALHHPASFGVRPVGGRAAALQRRPLGRRFLCADLKVSATAAARASSRHKSSSKLSRSKVLRDNNRRAALLTTGYLER
jgi:hypothetical protein